jgi:hypothetical protein
MSEFSVDDDIESWIASSTIEPVGSDSAETPKVPRLLTLTPATLITGASYRRGPLQLLPSQVAEIRRKADIRLSKQAALKRKREENSWEFRQREKNALEILQEMAESRIMGEGAAAAALP